MPTLQVCLYTCGDLIANVPFFEDAEEGFTTSVVTLLRPAVSAALLCLASAAAGQCLMLSGLCITAATLPHATSGYNHPGTVLLSRLLPGGIPLKT